MTGHASGLVALGAAMVLAQSTTPSPQQEPAATFRAGADAVSVEASVRRDKRPVTGLKISDFELLDNGVPQEISDLSYERLPIDVTMLSMSAPASPGRCSINSVSPCGS